MQTRSFEPWIFGFAADVDDMAKLTPRSSTLQIIVVHPFFITGHATMQKKLSFSAVEAAFLTWQDAVGRHSALTRTAPNGLALESLVILLNFPKLLCDQLLMILQVQLAPVMSVHEVMSPIFRLETFPVR